MPYVSDDTTITLTDHEQKLLLSTTGKHRDGFRDHMIFAVAIGTALREHEICALKMHQIFDETGKVRRRSKLDTFKRSNSDAKLQEFILPDALQYKFAKFYRWKEANGEPMGPNDPVFYSREGGPLSTRMLRYLFAKWQKLAGFERRLTFHHLRHTALTHLYANTKDIRLTQRIARHKSVLSTQRYTHSSDEEVLRAARALSC